MKYLLTLAIICTIAFSCSSPTSSEKADQTMSDSLSSKNSVAEKSFYEDSKAISSSPASTDERKGGEKMKKESNLSKNNEQISTKSLSNVKQNVENQSDTIYLKNVRLSKKFIKTADLKFKVKNVEQVTHKIETLALKLNGYVQLSQIKSNTESSRTIEASSDSLLIVSEYFIDNNLIIRVPSIYFDSVLNEISKLHIYLEHRQVKTEDVSTIFLRNKLKAEKNTEYEKRIQKASDNSNRRLDDIVEAERQASEMAEKAIDKKIENYELQDRIDFSTISMNIYQANSVFKEKVKNTQLHQYQPSFWQRAWDAILVGWQAILDLVIVLLNIWPLYVLAALIYVGIKYLRKRLNK